MQKEINDSPFHRGERKIQSKLGVRENMERFGRMVIRDHLPEQHQQFYQQLPFILVGHADPDNNAWASIICEPKGFIESPTNTTVEINTSLINGDPLKETLELNSASNIETPLGVLGIELPSRRRNRIAAHVTDYTENQIQLQVDQAFGNCPQYIQARELTFPKDTIRPAATVESFCSFDSMATQHIESADTFFIASHYNSQKNKASDGADVSHRGGRPGFVKVSDDKNIIIPDYLGNNHFNTFGNIDENGKAGLLFIDFESGDLLTLTGTAKINWDPEAIKHFDGAQRLLEFKLTKGRRIKSGLAVQWSKAEFSQNSLLTGTWQESELVELNETKRNQWVDYEVKSTVQESKDIRSIYLTPVDGKKMSFIPGQFLTVKSNIEDVAHIRTYTVSSASDDPYYRISVKREISNASDRPNGIFSNYVHDQLQVGDFIQAKAPSGQFSFESNGQASVLLMAAGIGITPMISLLRQALINAVKTRHLRPITLIAIARNLKERAFYQEIGELIDSSGGQMNVYWCLTQPEPDAQLGIDYDIEGRPDEKLIEQVLTDKDNQVYLCGPGAFMQASYDTLRKLGISDPNIYAEAFGPSALMRDDHIDQPEIAEQALVSIVQGAEQSIVEQQWSRRDGSLLEFLESHGFSPSFACRSGQCGSCKAKLTAGVVSNFLPVSAEIEEGDILLCCSKPSKNKQTSMPEISIQLLDV